MRASKNVVIVKIHKELQELKRSKKGVFFIPRSFNQFRNNLQYGDVISVGSGVFDNCPEVEVGGIAIFSHIVEGNEVSANSDVEGDPGCFLDLDVDGNELRYIVSTRETGGLLFGVIPRDGNVIYPAANVLFLSTDVKQSMLQNVKGVQLYTPTERATLMFNMSRINELIKEYSATFRLPENDETYKIIENAKSVISNLQIERSKLSRESKIVSLYESEVLFTPSITDVVSSVSPGDVVVYDGAQIYPLELNNSMRFALIQSFYASVWGKYVKGKFVPLNDRVVVKPASRARINKSVNIIIPDKENDRFKVGIITHLPLTKNSIYDYSKIKLGMTVLYHEDIRSSTKIYFEDQLHIILHYELILSIL
jgi:co-chaperonin GroES (HSP10)